VGDGKGLSIIMLGTPVGSGLQSVDDLGVKGGIPVILRTFRIGGEAGSDASDASTSDSTSSGDDASIEPTDETPSEPDAKPGLKEIRPINEDSTF